MSHFLKDLPAVSFFGRPYHELLGCFGLDESELFGRSILECPSGPSSFIAEATRRGFPAIGVDPLFYRCPKALRDLARADFAAMFERVRRSEHRFVRGTYHSIEEAEAIRARGLEQFLADYPSGFVSGRYRAAALPRLPFADQSFDLSLCAHFLFLYTDHFDHSFHLEAIEELCRVTAEEVRIHPLVNAVNLRYTRLEEVIDRAADCGFAAEIRPVAHEFFRGANETLILRRRH